MRVAIGLTAIAILALLAARSAAQSRKSSEEIRRELDQIEERRHEAEERTFAFAREKLVAFKAERPQSCDSENLKKARSFAFSVIKDAAKAQGRNAYQFRAGAELLNVADAAKDAKCRQFAREIYDLVIKVFVSSRDAPLRQRAQIGIDDLRG